MLPPPPSSTLFPYTTLFRSDRHPRALPPSRLAAVLGGVHARHAGGSDPAGREGRAQRSEEHTSELQSHHDLVCRLLLEKKKKKKKQNMDNKEKSDTTQ